MVLGRLQIDTLSTVKYHSEESGVGDAKSYKIFFHGWQNCSFAKIVRGEDFEDGLNDSLPLKQEFDETRGLDWNFLHFHDRILDRVV